jgi:methylated-DNA-protein-cysteine methyltransferase related protein
MKKSVTIEKFTFFNDVYEITKLIPSGRITSYGAIAEYLGMKSGARMVGWALNNAHTFPDIPAHRVVNRNGLLSGKHHFGSPNEMQSRLELEGVLVENDTVKDFKTLFWNPKEHLSL